MRRDFISIIKEQGEHLQRILESELAVVEISEKQNVKIDAEKLHL